MYTIGQISEMFHIPISTLRYYDRECLFPEMERLNGIRRFSEREVEALRVIECLKTSGLEIRDIIGQKLAAEGVKSYAGKTLCGEVISGMIRQEKYTGCTLAQKFYTENHITHKQTRNCGELPMYFMEGTHECCPYVNTFEPPQKARVYGIFRHYAFAHPSLQCLI